MDRDLFLHVEVDNGVSEDEFGFVESSGNFEGMEGVHGLDDVAGFKLGAEELVFVPGRDLELIALLNPAVLNEDVIVAVCREVDRVVQIEVSLVDDIGFA